MSFKLRIRVIDDLAAIAPAETYPMSQRPYHKVEDATHASISEVQFVHLLRHHVQSEEKVLVSFVLPHHSVCFFSLQRRHHCYCRGLIYAAKSQHVAGLEVFLLSINFFLNGLTSGDALFEKFEDRVLLAQEILESDGLRFDDGLGRHVIYYPGDEGHLLLIFFIGKEEFVPIRPHTTTLRREIFIVTLLSRCIVQK